MFAVIIIRKLRVAAYRMSVFLKETARARTIAVMITTKGSLFIVKEVYYFL